MKGPARGNIHVKYERPSIYQSQMTKVNVFGKKVKFQGQRSESKRYRIK
jgi:hypothetical protein